MSFILLDFSGPFCFSRHCIAPQENQTFHFLRCGEFRLLKFSSPRLLPTCLFISQLRVVVKRAEYLKYKTLQTSIKIPLVYFQMYLQTYLVQKIHLYVYRFNRTISPVAAKGVFSSLCCCSIFLSALWYSSQCFWPFGVYMMMCSAKNTALFIKKQSSNVEMISTSLTMLLMILSSE